ncbi:MAG: N-acetylneuraminate [Desulfovibrionaceae bacterium]|nr:MAG: N-acetylneuraminate [Desulfovibrionaceae bacterium]
MPHEVTLAGRRIGPDSPVFVVAEVSANHNQSIERAEAILRAAKDAGADAVKLQTYTPDTMTLDCDAPWFRIKGTIWDGMRLHDLYRQAMTPWEWYPRLRDVARELGIVIFSTPFDATAVDFLESMDTPLHKVASFELVDLPLLRRIAGTGKPVIMSTGMATQGEIAEAVDCLRAVGTTDLVLLHCVSAYPAPPEQMRLRAIPLLADLFGVPSGLSDHSHGHLAAVAGVALGARLIEKHITLSRNDPGPDSSFSMEPHEFREMVKAIRTTEKALGEPKLEPSERESASRALRRSLFAVEDIRAGERFTEANVRSLRPGLGLHTRHMEDVLSSRARVDIGRGTPLSMDLLAQTDPEHEGTR